MADAEADADAVGRVQEAPGLERQPGSEQPDTEPTATAVPAEGAEPEQQNAEDVVEPLEPEHGQPDAELGGPPPPAGEQESQELDEPEDAPKEKQGGEPEAEEAAEARCCAVVLCK